jgi:chromatin remodeling complex protein RSC6
MASKKPTTTTSTPSKQRKARSVADVPPAAPAPQTPEVTIPDVPTTTAVDVAAVAVPPPADAVVHEKFEALNQKVADLSNNLKDLQSYLKAVQKELVKLAKTFSKRTRTRSVNPNAKKTPSGFAKPTKLSDALCDFLAVPKGTELARTDVTRRLNLYIKEHNLQDAKDKRKIHPDAKLQKVLNTKPEDNLTFFNLQSFIKHNFVKA